MPKQLAAASLSLALIIPAASVSADGAQNAAPSNVQQAAQSVQPAAPGKAAAAFTGALVPLRDVSEAAGALVQWNEAERSAVVLRGTTKIVAEIGQSFLTVNEKQIALDTPVQLVNEKTVVPLDALNTALGIKAGWDADANKIVAAKDDYALKASSFVALLNSGRFAEARSFMSNSLSPILTEQQLMQYWTGIAKLFGSIGPQLAVNTSSSSVHHNATALYQTPVAPFELTVRFDMNGGIDDLYVSPTVSGVGYTKPGYDNSASYVEKEVKIGEGPLALPGTLTTPVGKGPFPVVVLVHGSGPNDRDETIGAVKPFRDLAVGLAAQGIAVLRYEKITREHPFKSQQIVPFTANSETVDDAVRAVELLKTMEGIDPKRIYVAGHSQGGMLMPRIVEAAGDKDVAGAIVLAGPSRPLEDLIVEQLNFQLDLMRKAGQPTAAMEQQVAIQEQQLKLIKDPQYSLDNPPTGFMLGNPLWWLDIRNLYAGEEAKNQKVPMLIMQGDNDAQVFPDNLEGWKSSLSGRSDVQYKLYPKMNHTLVEFDGVSTGAEYAVPANVPETIISDIAKWIKQ